MKGRGFSRDDQLERYLQLRGLVAEAGCVEDSYVDFMLSGVGLSPLRGRRLAEKAMAITNHVISDRVMRARLNGEGDTFPDVDERDAVLLGFEHYTARPVWLPYTSLNRHMLIAGCTGSGKTATIWGCLMQLIADGVRAFFHDAKDESKRLINQYQDRAVVLRAEQFRDNLLEPVGDPIAYFSSFGNELGRCCSLRPETWSQLIEVLVRLHHGVKPEEAYPSMKDLEGVLHHLADKQGQRTLKTAARSLGIMNATLGRRAYVRRGIDTQTEYPMVGFQCLGLNPRFQQFLSAIYLLRSQQRSMVSGHQGESLASVYVMDEGALLFSRAFGSVSGYISPQVRMVTQVRSSGTGLIIGVQELSSLDDAVLGNVGVIFCLRTPNPSTARIACDLLGLPRDSMEELQNLPPGTGYLRCAPYTSPIKVCVPHYDAGEYISDKEVAEHMAPHLEAMDARCLFAPVQSFEAQAISYSDLLCPEPEPEPMPKKDALTQDAHVLAEFFEFLLEIEAHPEFGIREHYRSIEWSDGKGNRVRKALLFNRLVCVEKRVSPRGGRPVQILKVTEQGRRFIDGYRQRETRE